MASRSNKRKQTSETAVKPSPSKAVKKMATHEFKTSNGFVWKNDIHPTVFYLGPAAPAAFAGPVKIAAFDMDHTLIMPSSGAVFPKGRDDWTFWDERVPDRLKQLHAEGFQLLILSNQGGIGKGNQNVDDITGKICDISEALGLPVYASIACSDNEYRKPNTYMWEMMSNKFFGGVANIDHDDSFYCGDAAGRPKGWKKGAKKDFSASDRKFAYNASIGFSTPEEFFFGEAPAEFEWGAPLPKDLLAEAALAYESDSKQLAAGRVSLPNGWIGSDPLVPSAAELIVFCGPPASGKSSWAKKHLIPHGYEWVNQDTLKTKEKCIARTREALSAGGRVIVDNTNPDPAVRATYISIAQGLGVPCRCFYFRVGRELSGHLNLFREKVSKGERKRLSRVVFNVFWSKFEEPSTDEGFSDVCTVDFLPAFESPDIQKVFMQLNE